MGLDYKESRKSLGGHDGNKRVQGHVLTCSWDPCRTYNVPTVLCRGGEREVEGEILLTHMTSSEGDLRVPRAPPQLGAAATEWVQKMGCRRRAGSEAERQAGPALKSCAGEGVQTVCGESSQTFSRGTVACGSGRELRWQAGGPSRVRETPKAVRQLLELARKEGSI